MVHYTGSLEEKKQKNYMQAAKKLLIGTHNTGKFNLIKQELQAIDHEIISLADLGITHDVAETGLTYAENATLKAINYATRAQCITLADDGGIEIDALNGEPGIYSARYAGPNTTDAQKVEHILRLMHNVPVNKRQACFKTVLALALPDSTVHIFEGVMHGTIAIQAMGTPHSHLPYRQIFIPDGYQHTLDQLDDLAISYTTHRTKALRAVVDFLTSKS